MDWQLGLYPLALPVDFCYLSSWRIRELSSSLCISCFADIERSHASVRQVRTFNTVSIMDHIFSSKPSCEFSRSVNHTRFAFSLNNVLDSAYGNYLR